MMSTFCLATADDPPPGRFAAGLGHHGTLAFSFVVLVEKDDDPVGLPAKLARPRGVRGSAVKCQLPRTAWSKGSQASPFGLKRFGAILTSSPAFAFSRYSRSTSNSKSTGGS